MVEDRQAETTSYELEVVEMLWVDPGGGVDLQRIVVVRRVLEQPVRRIEHLVRQQEKPFSAAIVLAHTLHTHNEDDTHRDTPP